MQLYNSSILLMSIFQPYNIRKDREATKNIPHVKTTFFEEKNTF